MSVSKQAEEIARSALTRADADRSRYLDFECGDDADLRARVDALIRAHLGEAAEELDVDDHDDVDSLSEDGSSPHDATIATPRLMHATSERIGQYRLKRVIAAGGMGVVYEAMQDHPRRPVAVKIMKHGVTSRSALRRFEYESQILARLRHPGIVQVYESGVCESSGEPTPYFVMAYIPNARTITDYADERGLDMRARLQLFVQVCEAVHHGHTRGVIHRDLKPSNILVDSGGQVRVIDFGVARATDSDLAVATLQTDVGQLVGTLQYMSPEQCDADPHDLDTRSDIYTLGVVLYELLAGVTPYDVGGSPIYEATRIIRQDPPTRLSMINRHFGGDVETIVMKAMEKDREQRYSSASNLALDIKRYLNDEPITAQPPSMIYHLRLFTRRYRRTVMAASIVFLVVAVLLGLNMATMAQNTRLAQENEAAAEANAAALAEAFSRTVNSATFTDLIDAIHRADADIETLGPTRAKLNLLDALGEHLADLPDQAAPGPALRERLARTWDLMATIYGGASSGGVQDPDQAETLRDRAYEVRSVALQQFPDDPLLQLGAAKSHRRLGDRARDLARQIDEGAAPLWRESDQHYADALALLEPLASAEPPAPGVVRELAILRADQADALDAQGRGDEANRLREESLHLRQVRVEANPNDVLALRDLVQINKDLGHAAFGAGDLDAAQRRFDAALAGLRRVCEMAPGRRNQRKLMTTLSNEVATTAVRRDDLNAALPAYDEALRLAVDLLDEDRYDTQQRRSIFITLDHAAKNLQAIGRPAEARRRWRVITEWASSVRDLSPLSDAEIRIVTAAHEGMVTSEAGSDLPAEDRLETIDAGLTFAAVTLAEDGRPAAIRTTVSTLRDTLQAMRATITNDGS